MKSTMYELRNTVDSNLIGTYPTEEAALDVIRTALETHSRDAVAEVGLGVEDRSGTFNVIATGEALISLACMPSGTPSTPRPPTIKRRGVAPTLVANRRRAPVKRRPVRT